MSFLYPLFLAAAALIAIPILIHLFNLRRYKTVYFPSTRFLKNIQLHSQKLSQVRYKWLLALRILFLLALILAFAQPFFRSNKGDEISNRLQVIYIDNSSSMSLKKGVRNLLDLAKEAAGKQLENAPEGTRFVVLTNDKPVSYQPVPAEKAIASLKSIDISTASKSSNQIFATIQGLTQSEATAGADVYYYSDFQQSSFSAQTGEAQLQGIRFFGVPVRPEVASNVFIDTAFLATPVLQTGQSNRLIVKSRLVGKQPTTMPIMQLSINGQVKSAVSLNFNDQNETEDTLSFQVNGSGWQKIALTLNDATVRFDDTFRITARSASNLSVLVINESHPNPYIQAAFRAYNGFRMDQRSLHENANWKEYNLIILNGITRFSEDLIRQIVLGLQQGQSICIFPGKTSNLNALNEGFSKIADISIAGIDTAVQTVSNLQQGSELVRDLFERVPENVQLPIANWHYMISAGLSANQQSILSFRNGDPFLAQYTPYRGKLYVAATSAELSSGNFPGSYFFVPFLYQMTAQSKGSDAYAITAGNQQPIFLSLANADERNMLHVYGADMDLIPPQRASGGGLEVFLGNIMMHPGFYTLVAKGTDSTLIAVNGNRAESQLELWDLEKLRSTWKGDNISWMNANSTMDNGQNGSLPLWKVCVILALLMLAAESYLLARSYRKQTLAPR
ncbi:MAG TPA: BatA domain-containing protein [Flavipsychrobacter sp.]|nr:BatA domain-containing protein [Flavipsychrobacter sp.]